MKYATWTAGLIVYTICSVSEEECDGLEHVLVFLFLFFSFFSISREDMDV